MGEKVFYTMLRGRKKFELMHMNTWKTRNGAQIHVVKYSFMKRNQQQQRMQKMNDIRLTERYCRKHKIMKISENFIFLSWWGN